MHFPDVSPTIFYGSFFDEDGPYSVAFAFLAQQIFDVIKANFEEYAMKTDENVTSSEEVLFEETSEKLAYQAYKEFINEKFGESPLPGLDYYSSQQTFWIALGLTQCSKNGFAFHENELDFQDDFGCYY